ncbi:hypothetical protein WJX72_010372 [[Myrmecia] bisecta]|uniref:ceramide glucosyltransferase n=1 Tax=[Myrmecia] bisecta TaxID=41462 RepID=A0AAW1P516_9CHLO
MCYDGPLEFLFVVDDCQDAAHAAVHSVIQRAPKGLEARVLIAGAATSNSQKIHNIQTGIWAAESAHKYVLCLDDDVVLHPGSLQMLVDSMEAQPDMFMATGYPFDLPPPHSSVLTYCVMVYHLPLLIAFSIRQHTQFVWGGCMLFPLQDMRSDRYGIMQAWSDGGYSDDLIVAAKCGEHGLQILCPSFSILPQWLEGECGLRRYWNYLRRQLYVMDTYASPLNRRINHSMMVVHAYLSWAFVLPATTAGLRICLWVLETLLLPSQQVWDGPGTSLHWLRMFGVGKCPLSSASHLAFLACWALAALSLRWMSRVILDLFDQLSPASAPLPRDLFNWLKLWLGFYINNAVLPFCMLYTKLCTSVEWSGVRYAKSRGRVMQVAHLPASAGLASGEPSGRPLNIRLD